MVFILPPLPYDYTALEPHISKETLQFHHDKHHAAYVNKLNDLAKGSSVEKQNLTDVVLSADGVMFNQAAQAWNHEFYWKSLGPNCGGLPTGSLKDRIEQDFESFQNFKEKFSALAAGHFGSGWVWLVYKPDTKSLAIEQTHDAGNPLRMKSGIPLLTCDVWEHAYYIDYRNSRPDYIKAWWNLVNWNFAQENYQKAIN